MAKKRTKIPKEIENQVLSLSNNRCCICQTPFIQFHHIDENPSNHNIDNIAPLCPNCHTRAHSKAKLERRRSLLVTLDLNLNAKIDKTDRENIIRYIKEQKLPVRPKDEILLSKEFINSCMSINQPPYRISNKLRSLIGQLPLAHTIPKCLSIFFNEPDFLDDHNWTFRNLSILSAKLCAQLEITPFHFDHIIYQ